MDRNSRLDSLLDQWEEHRIRGETITPEELCRDCPELLSELVNQIRKLEDIDNQFPDPASTTEDHQSDPPVTADFKVPEKIGRYHIRDKIAAGGMGVVLRASDTEFERQLAIKVMLETPGPNSDLDRRFLEEAQITGHLQHPGIPPVHERGRLPDGRPYFAMKLIEGETLSALLREEASATDADNTRLPRLLSIFEQICQTVAYAHSRGVIHRDLKPNNIMVGAFGEVQVMDWGLAKKLPQTTSETSGESVQPATYDLHLEDTDNDATSDFNPSVPEREGTADGRVMGTVAYMPPEQANGQIDQIDERSDVFGLGAILCTILTGLPPYSGENLLRKAQTVDLRDGWNRLERCQADNELVELCRRCLSSRREDRPANANEVAEQVTAYQESVQARVKQAEIEAAKATVQAKAERTQRELSDAKAIVEQKRRRATLILALVTFILLGSLSLGGIAIWYQRASEHGRYQAGIRRVYEFLASYDYEKAEETIGDLRKTMSYWVPHGTREELEKAHQDTQFLTALDRVQQNLATSVNGKFFDTSRAAREYEKAFADAGFPLSGVNLPSLEMWLKEPKFAENSLTCLAATGDLKDLRPTFIPGRLEAATMRVQ
ncbi:MAG: serine/threonine-protein kinase [Gemmataceae bacterium]